MNCLWALPRDVLDIFPLVLKYSTQVEGLKPFRLNNFWLSNASFVEVVRTFWNVPSKIDWMTCSLRDKLKAPKVVMKVKNKEVFRNMEFKFKRCVIR